MKLYKKSEWLELESPVGEPGINWNPNEKYFIERLVKPDGSVIWFGSDTNWVKNPDGQWTVLSTNYKVMPDKEGVYPSERSYFKPCDVPVYEKLYLEMKSE